MGASTPHGYLGPPDSAFQTASRSVQPFLHSSGQTVLHFTMGCDIPFKITPSHLDIWDPSNTLNVSPPKSDWRARQTDRPTDHATPSVANDRIYLVLRCDLILSVQPFYLATLNQQTAYLQVYQSEHFVCGCRLSILIRDRVASSHIHTSHCNASAQWFASDAIMMVNLFYILSFYILSYYLVFSLYRYSIVLDIIYICISISMVIVFVYYV